MRGLTYLRVDRLGRTRRTIPLAEVRRLTVYHRTIDGPDHWQPHVEYGLAIETLGRTLCVGQSRDPDAVERLRREVEWHLQDACPAWVNAPECPECEVLDLTESPDRPPSDSQLSCRRACDRTVFHAPRCEKRLPFWLPVFAFLLYFDLILVSVDGRGRSDPVAAIFVLAMTGGAGLIYGLRRVWVVRPGELVTSLRFAGHGWSCTADIERLERIELRRIASRTPWDARFYLVLIDGDGEESEVIGPLTEGEARWMAGIVAEILRDDLPRSTRRAGRGSIRPDRLIAGSLALADPWLDEGLDGAWTDDTLQSLEH